MRPEPAREQICAAIEDGFARKNASLAAGSKMLHHSPSYLWRFVNEGTPDRLAPRDRRLLAAFLNIDEFELGWRPGAPRFVPKPPPRARINAARWRR